jgi:hypothetical protein
LTTFVQPFGQLMDMNFATSSRSDLRWARVVVDMAARDLIPSVLWFELKQSNGITMFIQVRYEVEGVATVQPPSTFNEPNLVGHVGGQGGADHSFNSTYLSIRCFLD